VDAFHVSGGVIDRLVTGMVNAADDGDALNVGAATAVKQAVDVPVIAVGRIHDPVRAEQILAEGRADFIAMGRPMLADPELAAKVQAGQEDRVRRCISCENCIDAMEQRFSVDCAVNPRTGKERELSLHTVPNRKRVIVIGGGPGGLEAARVAAERGHRVSLFERNAHLGGALVWASIVHPENEPFLRYLRDEISRSTVAVELSHAVDAEEIAALDPDAVIVATGASGHTSPALPELLASPGGPPVGRRVVIVGGGLAAIQIAEFLAAQDRFVTVLETGRTIAPQVGLKRRTEHMDRLDRLAVPVHVRVEVHRVTDDGVVFTPYGGTPRELVADSVIVAGQAEADTALFDALTDRLPGAKVHAVGDCTGLGLIRKATEDGARAACSI